MAANMQHMAGAGGMMPQHRPRLTQVQLNQYLYQNMLAQQQPHSGWQAGVTIQERMIKCHNLITNIALAVSSIDFMKAAEVGVSFERDAFNKAPDKPTYEAQISNKTNDFFRRRQANEQNLSNNLQAQAAAQAQQQLMMNQNSAMQNQMGRGIGQNPQQGFQHLQHQMQASQIPQQAQMGVNMGNQGGQPIGPNQQMFQMAGGQARPQNVPTDISSLTPADQQKVMELAQKMAANAHEQQKNQLRAMVTSRFAQRAQEFTAQGKDPVLIWFQHQALTGLTRNMNAQRQRMQQAGIPPNMNPAQAQAMMQAGRGQMNPAMPNAAGMQGGNGDFGQFNAMESIMNQQKAGILAQEQGQMVVPASNGPARNATPQPMTAGQGQGMPNAAGPNQTLRPPQTQQQQLSMQQAQQLKMEQQQSQHAAQMRAQQQARQLQGQPNGLGGAPPSQSPGMNTLNTPMRRPPSAMNPMEAQGGGQASGSFAGTLDPRFNQGNQRPMSTTGNMNLNNNPIYHSMMASFNDQQRQAVQTLPPDKLHEVMSKWQEQQRKMQMSSMQQQPGNNMQGRQFNMPNAGNPLAANGMMPQQGQPGAPNQQAMIQQQQMLARLRNQAAPVAPAQQAMMDSMDMPPPVLAQIGSSLRAPPDMRKWKDLRQWLAQNPVNPQIMAQLEKVQRQQFVQYMQKSMERRNQQMQAQAAAQLHQPQQPPQPQPQQQMQLQQQQQQQQQQPQPQQQQAQQQGQPQGQPLMQNGMQAGNAGPNQPPSGLPQGMPPNMPPNIPQHLLQVTQQEIIGARKTNPKIASLTDDQLRQFIIQIKQRNMTNAMQKDMAMRQAQGGQNMQVQGSQNGPVSAPQQQQQQQPPLGQSGGSQLNATVPTPAPVSQPAQSKQTSATPDPKAAANAAPTRNNNRPAPNNQQQPPNPSPATAQKNLKRPSTDDAIDVPQTAPQQQPQRPIPTLTAEQIKNLTPAQKAQYEQIKSRQQAMAASNANVAATETDFEKLRRIGVEEQKLMATEHMPDIQMSPEQRQETAQKLMRIVVDMGKIGKALGRWYAATRDDARAKSYFRARLRMIRQFTDGETMTNPKPVFSVRPAEIDEARRLLESMARDCASLGKKAGAAPPQQGGQAPTPTQAGATPSQGGQPAPLSAANLEKQTQALNKMHGRSNSKSGGPPAAPTTSQPPFSFGATSPHGQPAYIGKPKVNRENLTLPPRKKTKTDNTPPQPSQATPSPQISKSGSPELKRQEPPKPMFQCPEPDCDTSRCGFPSEQALHAHIQEDHVKPREDPMKFAQENLALALGLDANGQVKMEPQAMAQPMAPNASKQARTPVSNAAATPMSRDASMQRTGSKIGGKPQDNKASVGKLEDTPKLEDKQPDMTVVAPAPAIDPWANTVDPASLFTKVGGFEFGLDGTVSNMAVYRSLTPNDTPESSKDSGSSEPNSDISEGANLDIDMNWHPIDVDLLLDMNNINMDVADVAANSTDAFMLEDDTQMEQFTNWDEVSVDFSKPYQFDNSLYSLDVS